MEITCGVCTEGVGSDGGSCSVCGGDGLIDLADSDFRKYIQRWALHGVIWNEMLTRLDDIEDKVDDVIVKCNDIKEVVDEL